MPTVLPAGALAVTTAECASRSAAWLGDTSLTEGGAFPATADDAPRAAIKRAAAEAAAEEG
jgi:hypothetical protein